MVVALAIAGCGGALDIGAPCASRPDPVGFAECGAQSCDFVGQGMLAGLGSTTPPLLLRLTRNGRQ